MLKNSYKYTILVLLNMLLNTALANVISLSDSLENVLQNTATDTAKVMVYNRFARILIAENKQVQDYNQGLQIAQQGLALAQQIRFAEGEAELHRTIGNAYNFLVENEKALSHYEQAIEICERMGDIDCKALNYYNLALIYQKMSRFYFALHNFQNALEIWIQTENVERTILVYVNIVRLYISIEQFEHAGNWATEAVEIAIEAGDKKQAARLYELLARINVRFENMSQAEEYFQRALQMHEELGERFSYAITINNMASTIFTGDPEKKLDLLRQSAKIFEPSHPLLFNVYSNIALFFKNQNQNDSALYYYEKSLEKAILSGNPQSMAQAYIFSGNFFKNEGNLNRAERYYYQAYEIATRSVLPQFRSNALAGLGDINEQRGNYQTALKYLLRYQNINDSLVNEDNKRSIQRLTIQHQFDRDQIAMREETRLKLEKNQQTLKHQQIVIVIVLFALLLTAVLMVVNIRTNRELNRYKNNLEEMVETKTRELTISKERAEESNRLKSAFLANMSHEIRTPLNGIIGFLQFINDANIQAERKEEYINIINNCSKQLVKIIDDIIDISKIEAHQMNINPVPMHLNDVMKEMQTFFEMFIKTNKKEHIQLILDETQFLEQDLINADIIRLKQVISNLLSNAIKFTDKGYVRFGYELIDNYVLVFFVEDTGIGISESQFENIFEQFRQVNFGNAKYYGGIGLGLSISRSLVQLMGGEITVNSTEGVGSTFSFTITYTPCDEK